MADLKEAQAMLRLMNGGLHLTKVSLIENCE